MKVLLRLGKKLLNLLGKKAKESSPINRDYYGREMKPSGSCPECHEDSEWGINDQGLVTFICTFCNWYHTSLYNFSEPERWQK